jgi:hypothetical protein
MREHSTAPGVPCVSTRVTRRGFVRSAAIGALAVAGVGGSVAFALPAAGQPVPGDWWTRARAVADSGALGTLCWVEARYPAAARASEAAWTEHVAPILAAIGAPAAADRACEIGATAPTVVLEFDAAPPVFLAPAAGRRAPHARVVLRGTHASLLVHDDGLWLRPESPRVSAHRV